MTDTPPREVLDALAYHDVHPLLRELVGRLADRRPITADPPHTNYAAIRHVAGGPIAGHVHKTYVDLALSPGKATDVATERGWKLIKPNSQTAYLRVISEVLATHDVMMEAVDLFVAAVDKADSSPVLPPPTIGERPDASEVSAALAASSPHCPRCGSNEVVPAWWCAACGLRWTVAPGGQDVQLPDARSLLDLAWAADLADLAAWSSEYLSAPVMVLEDGDALVVQVGSVGESLTFPTTLNAVLERLDGALESAQELERVSFAQRSSERRVDDALENSLLEAVERLRTAFADGELAYLAVTSKPEHHLRDRLAWLLHTSLPPHYVVSREWRKRDLAVLEGSEPRVLIEAKALYGFDALSPAGRAKYLGYLVADLDKMAGTADEAAPYLLSFVTHVEGDIAQHLRPHVVKYSSGIAAVGLQHGTEAVTRARQEWRRSLATLGAEVTEVELSVGDVWGLGVTIDCFLAGPFTRSAAPPS